MKKVTCNRCGYVWQARVDNPKRCPKCKTTYWATERTRLTRAEIEGKA